MAPLVSILIPSYNAERWIADTIRSAMDQTWPRKEIIIVDDGSTDRTLEVARAFASKTICVTSQPNQGAAAARNKALSLSQGEYLQWLDADDLLAPEKVAQQMRVQERLSSQRILLSCAWGRFHHSPRRSRFIATSLWQDLAPVDWLVRKLGENVFMQTGVWLVSRELTQQAGPWDTRLLSDDDGEYFCRVMLSSEAIRFVPEGKVFYRIPGPASLSSLGASKRKVEALFLSMRLHIGHLRAREDSPRVREACVKYLQTGLRTFDPDHPELAAAAHQLAVEMGRRLDPVRFSWRYKCLEKLIGHAATSRAQLRYDAATLAVLRGWDRLVLRCTSRGQPCDRAQWP